MRTPETPFPSFALVISSVYPMDELQISPASEPNSATSPATEGPIDEDVLMVSWCLGTHALALKVMDLAAHRRLPRRLVSFCSDCFLGKSFSLPFFRLTSQN
jgi:hypothetical protein